MAISIDKVYQKVLALANKEQRGYITPQEFNLFADQAQQDIFNQYFYDLERYSRGRDNGVDYANKLTNLESKVSVFEVFDEEVAISESGEVALQPLDVYKLGVVTIKYVNKPRAKEAERLSAKELNLYKNGRLTNESSLAGPYYVEHYSPIQKHHLMTIWPNKDTYAGLSSSPYAAGDSDTVKINYIKNPISPQWTYSIVGTNALYDPSLQNFRNFQLHVSEESLLVSKILQLAGVSIKDYQLTQAAVQEEIKSKQEKQ
tara:strand:+ start:856 stop:1632 length:777 start_codon:yes stop_codon:yes gene_type:complete